VIFESERMVVAIVDGRTSLPLDAPPRLFVACTGTYRFDGKELTTQRSLTAATKQTAPGGFMAGVLIQKFAFPPYDTSPARGPGLRTSDSEH
jgi:hypothetical protein